ncbi:MAG: RNA polymerase sigma-70 factor [Bacteroidota bacterium]
MPVLTAHTDPELLALIQEDDQVAFAELYRRYWDKLFVVARNRLQDELEAEEVVQDVFYSIWKRRATLAVEHSLRTYLSVAVKYQVINRQSKKYYSLRKEELPDTLGRETTELWFAEKELRQQLSEAIDLLPEKCRIVFKKSREEGLSNAQIADELGVSEKNVEAHITRAIHTLRGSLQVSLPLLAYLLKS